VQSLFNRVLLAGALLALSFGIAAEGPHQALQLRGSTTLLPMAQRVAEAYMAGPSGGAVSVSGGGSYRGYKAILDGTADIGLVSGPPTPELRKLAANRKIEWVSTLVGYEAVVAVVHPSNPLTSLHLTQLQAIFSGRVRNWRELGLDDAPIEVLRGPPTAGLTELWRERVLGEEASFDPRARVVDAAGMLEQVAANPAAIGTLGLASVGGGVKPLAIDGVTASRETIRDGSYPVRGELALVTGPQPSPAAREFIQYFVDPRTGMPFIDLIHAVPAQ
jgi:phosphate transport system substrate-binding protein